MLFAVVKEKTKCHQIKNKTLLMPTSLKYGFIIHNRIALLFFFFLSGMNQYGLDLHCPIG